MPSFSYYLGPWAWRPDGPRPHWAPPDGTVGCIDLRSATHCGTPAVQDGVGLFATTARLSSDYTLLGRGDLRELATSGKMRSTFEGLTRYKPSGSTLCTLLRDCLMAGGDPGGTARCKPLMPDAKGNLDMYLGGHGLIHREPFSWGEHPHTPQVQAVHRGDVATCHAQHPLHTTQKVLGGLCHQYRLPTEQWRVFVPPVLQPAIPGPLSPATTIQDTFNRADSTTLGTSSDTLFSWTEVSGNLQILSNQVQTDSGNNGYARAEYDLSSANHSVTVTVGYNIFGAMGAALARFNSAAFTTYMFVVDSPSAGNTGYYLYKIVAGTSTLLDTLTVGTTAGNTPGQLAVSGSTLQSYHNTVTTLRNSLTDTAITGNLRTGIAVFSDIINGTIDDFTATDLATTAPLTAQLVWIVSGVSGARNPICFKGTTLSAIWLPSGGASLTYAWVFADLHGQAGFVSTATSADIARTWSVAGGSLGTRRVSSTVSSLASAVGSTITSATLVVVGAVKIPSLWDGIVQKESQRFRRTWPV